MQMTSTEKYNGWRIDVGREKNMCSSFCFDITDPSGRTQHVSMGGETQERALERAREMIDMEIDFNTEN